jgi:hypothetical protein
LDRVDGHEVILIPDVVLDRENRFLDDVTLPDVEEALGIRARRIESTPEGLARGMAEE